MLAFCHIQIGNKKSDRAEKKEHFESALKELRTGLLANPYINHSLASGAYFSLGNIEEDPSLKKAHYEEALKILSSKPTLLTANDIFIQQECKKITAPEAVRSGGGGASAGAADDGFGCDRLTPLMNSIGRPGTPSSPAAGFFSDDVGLRLPPLRGNTASATNSVTIEAARAGVAVGAGADNYVVTVGSDNQVKGCVKIGGDGSSAVAASVSGGGSLSGALALRASPHEECFVLLSDFVGMPSPMSPSGRLFSIDDVLLSATGEWGVHDWDDTGADTSLTTPSLPKDIPTPGSSVTTGAGVGVEKRPHTSMQASAPEALRSGGGGSSSGAGFDSGFAGLGIAAPSAPLPLVLPPGFAGSPSAREVAGLISAREVVVVGGSRGTHKRPLYNQQDEPNKRGGFGGRL